MNVFETKRLFLRELTQKDAVEFYNLNSDLEVIKYTGDVSFDTLENAKEFLMNYDEYEKNGFGRWAVILKKDGGFIGWCGLKRNLSNEVDLGFRFYKKHWNKGYATEASLACLQYGFEDLGIKEIIGRSASKNTASINVLKKIGMKFWKKDLCQGISNAQYFKISKNMWEKSNP